jgi:Kef-type K+ transport system membrane component KefB
VKPDTQSLVLIVAAVALAPLIAGLARRFVLPVVVVELVLGIVIGPDVLDIAHEGSLVTFLATLGMSFLFFLAGLELDLDRVRGRPLRLASIGLAMSLVLAAIIAAVLSLADVIGPAEPVAIALMTTAIGTLMPILRDAGELDSPFGTQVLASGAVGEFGPIVLISVFLASNHTTIQALAVLAGFLVLTGLIALIALRARPPHVVNTIRATLHSSGQLGVRLALLLLFVLLWIASKLDIDLALGGFAAGLLVGLVTREDEADPIRVRLDGIGFGLFVPFFFVVSGMRFGLDELFSSTTALLLLPVFLASFLVVRGLPALLARNDVGRQGVLPLALFSATALPLVVAVTGIAVSAGHMSAKIAASLIGAAMVSVLVFPSVAIALRRAQAG